MLPTYRIIFCAQYSVLIASLIAFGIAAGVNPHHYWTAMHTSYNHAVYLGESDNRITLILFITPVLSGFPTFWRSISSRDDAKSYAEHRVTMWGVNQVLTTMGISMVTHYLSAANNVFGNVMALIITGCGMIIMATADETTPKTLPFGMVAEVVAQATFRYFCIHETSFMDHHTERAFMHDSLLAYHFMASFLEIICLLFFYRAKRCHIQKKMGHFIWESLMADFFLLLQLVFLFIAIDICSLRKHTSGLPSL